MDVLIEAEGIGTIEINELSTYATTPQEGQSVCYDNEELAPDVVQVVEELTADIQGKALRLRDILLAKPCGDHL